jgi:molybdopterin-guanine dinucleotide biosynthesis protein B
MHELRGAPEQSLAELIDRMSPVDIVFVEGFKRDPIPKIEVHRPELGKSFLYRDDPLIMAIAAPAPIDAGIPWLPLDAPRRIASFILELPAVVSDR